MNRNGHPPAGRAGQGGPAGPGQGDVPGEQRHGNGAGGGGRGGGQRRGRHYGSHYQNQHQHHQPHYNHNQHHNQHNQFSPYAQFAQQPQLYQTYMGSYANGPYAYAPMQAPYTPNGTIPAPYMPYQQPYGRQAAGMPAPFVPMMAPNGMAQMGQPMPMPLHMGSPQQPPLQQQQQPPPPLPPSQQLPPQAHMSPSYARLAPQAPLIVSSTPAQQLPAAMPPMHATPFDAPPLPASMGLPPTAPLHMSLPLRPDVPPHIPQSAAFPPHMPHLNPSDFLHQFPPPMAGPQHNEPPTGNPEITNGVASLPPPFFPQTHGAPISATRETSATEVVYSQASELAIEGQVSSRRQSSDHVLLTPSEKRGGPLAFGDLPTVATEVQKRDILEPNWLSEPGVPFPSSKRLPRRRRKIAGYQDVELPLNPQEAAAARVAAAAAAASKIADTEANSSKTPDTPATPKATAASVATTDTASTQDRPSESPMSTSRSSLGSTTPAAASKVPNGESSRPTVPALPIVPVVPAQSASSKVSPSGSASTATTTPAPAAATPVNGEAPREDASEAGSSSQAAQAPQQAPAPARPTLWTGLFSKSTASTGVSASDGTAAANGHATNGTNGSGSFAKTNGNSLAEALTTYRVDSANKVAFIEPRGLINTGNMCYMNSVLQALAFCIPFYDFLDHVGRKAAFSFKSETPMVDAMIMFLREFKVIDRADPIDLQRRLKSDDIERYGEAFIPEFVYDAIKQLSRFSSMRRGHQQDAEEFLGFLLDSLTEECTKVMQSATATPTSTNEATPAASITSEVPDLSNGNGGGWLEVGPRQRAAVTRSSGYTSLSPVNSIFGGQLRSELRVPGLKDSVTLEPYLSLQLHIDSPEVRNIVDALQNLTRPETLQGNFNSPHGKNVNATKQVFIESLPPVLILHLKRFQFDAQGGTVKIWKKVGYPLELEIPREIFARRRRNAFLTEALPKYRLNAVIYHHGKHANGGHYTVDVLREDGREWIRLDDTVIRRIRNEDVAAAGEEESEPSAAGKATSLSQSSSTGATTAATSGSTTPAGGANRFAGIDDDDAGENESEWRQVYPTVNGSNKKWSAVANGSASAAAKAKQIKESIKDNKVAYLLFYQRVN